MTTRSPRLSARKKLAFAGLTCFLGLAGLEGTLRALGYPQGIVRSFGKLWNPDSASRAALPGLFRPDFDGRVAYPPELAYDVRFNSLGLRGPELGAGPRLLLLGDSVTFGYHVDDAQAYPAQLQRVLAAEGMPHQAINAGCGHFTITDERRYMAERLLALDPQVVLLQFCSNDLTDGELRRDPTLYAEILRGDQTASNLLGQTALGEVLLRAQIVLKRWRKGPPEALGLAPQERVPDGAWATYEAELTALRDLLAERGIRLALVAFPDLIAARDDQPSALDAGLAEITTRLGIPFRSALPDFRQAEDPDALYLYPLDPHPSASGNRLLAQVAAGLLRDAKLLEPQDSKDSE